MTPDPYDRPATHWGELCAFLSLDLTEPFWPHFSFTAGLDRDDLRARLRQAILLLRERAAADPSRLPDIRDLLFRENAMRLSREELAAFAAFGTGLVVDHGDDPQLSAWQIALTRFPEDFPETARRAGTPATLKAITDALQPPDILLEVSGALSAWDLQMCARHGWNPASMEMFPPADTLRVAMSMETTRRALALMSRELSPDARRTLRDEAQAVIDTLRVWMPAPLAPLEGPANAS